MRAQSPVRGGETVEPPPSCLPLLTCVLGGVLTTPLPPRRGEGPLLVAAFTALNSPKGRNKSHPSAPTASSHATKMR